jgi:hypothetical protein
MDPAKLENYLRKNKDEAFVKRELQKREREHNYIKPRIR